MNHSEPSKKFELDGFLKPRSSYHGQFSPQELVFNANLQEFSQSVDYICGLETGGKLPPHEAYEQIKKLWKELKKSKQELGIEDIGDSDNPREET